MYETYNIIHIVQKMINILFREYPCDHYTAIINVTLMNTGCPRSSVRDTALQLLQVLDKRFFGSGCVELLPPILPSESPVTAREYYFRSYE